MNRRVFVAPGLGTITASIAQVSQVAIASPRIRSVWRCWASDTPMPRARRECFAIRLSLNWLEFASRDCMRHPAR